MAGVLSASSERCTCAIDGGTCGGGNDGGGALGGERGVGADGGGTDGGVPGGGALGGGADGGDCGGGADGGGYTLQRYKLILHLGQQDRLLFQIFFRPRPVSPTVTIVLQTLLAS